LSVDFSSNDYNVEYKYGNLSIDRSMLPINRAISALKVIRCQQHVDLYVLPVIRWQRGNER
jgi:hypothetical protein